MYVFQFPTMLPTFEPATGTDEDSAVGGASKTKRAVSFADGGGSSEVKKEKGASLDGGADDIVKGKTRRAEGQAGRLDVYKDGRVMFRFGDVVMEVTGGSQSTFLQQVMVLDANKESAITLGELHRKFVVTPELESMLADVDLAEEEQRKAKEEEMNDEE